MNFFLFLHVYLYTDQIDFSQVPGKKKQKREPTIPRDCTFLRTLWKIRFFTARETYVVFHPCLASPGKGEETRRTALAERAGDMMSHIGTATVQPNLNRGHENV